MAAPVAKTRRHELRADDRGYYRPRIGFVPEKLQPGVKRKRDFRPKRFNLGTDKKLAEARYAAIQALYEDDQQAFGGNLNSWSDEALAIAEQIAKGEPAQLAPRPKQTPDAYSRTVEIKRRKYPSAHVTPTDPVAYREGVEINDDVIAKRMRELTEELRRLGALRTGEQLPDRPVSGTLHEALKAYSEKYLTTKPDEISTATMYARQSDTRQLIAAYPNMPLARLGLTQCQALFDHWKSKEYKHTTRRNRAGELSQFLNWLHTSSDFDWRKPTDYDTIKRMPRKNSGERKSIRELIGKKTFTVEQLRTIYKASNPLNKLLLLLGLNCCFGASESGRLEGDDVFQRQPNPLERFWKTYGYKSGEHESWIAYLRPKTGVAGCWYLWPETMKALTAYQATRPQTIVKRIIVTETGTSLYRDESKNAQSGFAKRWHDLIKNLKVPQLAFGTLRDHFSDWATMHGHAEEAAIGLAHGRPFKDDLAECYANRPFPRLFELQKQYREFLAPMFEK